MQTILLFQTGTTALFFAAQAGHIDVAKILIRYGAHIEGASLVRLKNNSPIETYKIFRKFIYLSFASHCVNFIPGWRNSTFCSLSRGTFKYGKGSDSTWR